MFKMFVRVSVHLINWWYFVCKRNVTLVGTPLIPVDVVGVDVDNGGYLQGARIVVSRSSVVRHRDSRDVAVRGDEATSI